MALSVTAGATWNGWGGGADFTKWIVTDPVYTSTSTSTGYDPWAYSYPNAFIQAEKTPQTRKVEETPVVDQFKLLLQKFNQLIDK